MAAITDAMQQKIDADRDSAFANGFGFGALATLFIVAAIYFAIQWSDARQQKEVDFRSECFYENGRITRDGAACMSREDGRIIFIKDIEGTWK